VNPVFFSGKCGISMKFPLKSLKFNFRAISVPTSLGIREAKNNLNYEKNILKFNRIYGKEILISLRVKFSGEGGLVLGEKSLTLWGFSHNIRKRWG
jgi:hypothetical protein